MRTQAASETSTVRRVFKAFQYRDFGLMWFGACISSIGTWMQIVAQGWLIYRLSHSPFLLALDQGLGGTPIFVDLTAASVGSFMCDGKKSVENCQLLRICPRCAGDRTP